NLPGNPDYSATAASFGVGAATGATQNVVVSAIDDRRVEAATETFASESLNITASGGANGTAGGTRTLAVAYNDSATVAITSGTTSVTEGGAAQNIVATLTIASTGSGTEQLDVAVSANLPGNADYSSTAATFTVGATTGATQNVVVNAID